MNNTRYPRAAIDSARNITVDIRRHLCPVRSTKDGTDDARVKLADKIHFINVIIFVLLGSFRNVSQYLHRFNVDLRSYLAIMIFRFLRVLRFFFTFFCDKAG